MKKFKVNVLYADSTLDNQGYRHTKKGTKIPKTRVPITLEYRKDLYSLLGFANLSWEGTTLIADIELTKDLSDLTIESLTPAVGGKYTGKNTKKSNGCSIEGIALSHSPNIDKRIESIGDQVKKK